MEATARNATSTRLNSGRLTMSTMPTTMVAVKRLASAAPRGPNRTAAMARRGKQAVVAGNRNTLGATVNQMRGERACREAHADDEIVQMVALARAHPGSRRRTEQDGRDEQYARHIAQPPDDKRIPDVRATETFRPEPEGSHERRWCGARHRGDGEEADIGDPIERKGLPAPAVEHPARQRGPGQAPQGSHPGEGKRLPGGQFHRE